MTDENRAWLIRFAYLGAIVALIVGFSFLGGCNTTTYAPIEYKAVTVPTVRGVKTMPVQWKLYTKSDLAALIKNSDSDEPVTLLAVTPDGYKNLSMNLAELERYIKQQKQVIVFLKKTLDQRSSRK